MKKIKLIARVALLILAVTFVTILNNSGGAVAQNVGAKLCSAVVPGNFRDTISVPSGWSAGTCQQYKSSVGAEVYQLGCTFNNSFSWGRFSGGTPNPNCGW